MKEPRACWYSATGFGNLSMGESVSMKETKTEVSSLLRDTILMEIGEIPISNTQKYRVLVVVDADTGETKVSAQRWWRKNTGSEWVVGKGFKLDKAKSLKMASLLTEGSENMDCFMTQAASNY